MSETPSKTASNGHRQANGRFAVGNRAAKGNPYARRVARLRAALLRAVTPEDMTAIVSKLVQDAKSGNVQAAKEIIERTLGKPIESDLLERIERLEAWLLKDGGG